MYLLYAPVMLAIGMRYCGNRDDAKDVMQECFIKILTQIEKFSGKGSFEGWIKRIMVNASLDFYKKKRKSDHVQIVEDHLEEALSEGPLDEGIDKSDLEKPSWDLVMRADFSKEEIIACLHAIPEHYRIIFNLFVLENYSHAEIAEQLGFDANVSRIGLFRAKEMIRKVLHQKSVERLTK